MRLLGRTSSINVRKVLLTAAELGVALEREDDWATPARPSSAPEFLHLNPNGLVPVLLDGDHVIWESHTICRYLVGRSGSEQLLPRAPFARSLVERWMDWVGSDLNRAYGYAFRALIRRDPAFGSQVEIERSVSEWNRLMGLLDGHLARVGPFASGSDFSLADICLGLSAHRWSLAPIERPELPSLTGYLDLLSERPSFARYANEGFP